MVSSTLLRLAPWRVPAENTTETLDREISFLALHIRTERSRVQPGPHFRIPCCSYGCGGHPLKGSPSQRMSRTTNVETTSTLALLTMLPYPSVRSNELQAGSRIKNPNLFHSNFPRLFPGVKLLRSHEACTYLLSKA